MWLFMASSNLKLCWAWRYVMHDEYSLHQSSWAAEIVHILNILGNIGNIGKLLGLHWMPMMTNSKALWHLAWDVHISCGLYKYASAEYSSFMRLSVIVKIMLHSSIIQFMELDKMIHSWLILVKHEQHNLERCDDMSSYLVGWDYLCW